MPDISSDTVLDQLQPIFQEALNDASLQVTRASSARNTPNWDSLAYIEIIEMTEMHFKVKFALGELQEMNDVGEMVDLVVEKVTAK